MSLVADSSSPSKQFSESDGFDCDEFISNSKLPNLGNVGSFHVESNSKLPEFDSSNIVCSFSLKRSKLNLSRDYEKKYGIYGEKGEFSGKKPRFSQGVAVAAVPLRSLPSSDVRLNPEKPVISSGKDDDGVGITSAIIKEKTLGQKDETWERESEKLTELIEDAKKFLNGCIDCKYSAPKRLEAVQEGNDVGIEIEGEDDDDEVCVLSPSEWSSLPFYQKGDGAKASIGKMRAEKGNKSCGEFWDMAESHVTKMADDVGLNSVATKTDKQSDMVPCYDLTETQSKLKCQEQFGYGMNHNELINLQFGMHDQPQYAKVTETLKLFEEHYNILMKDRASEFRGGKIPKAAHIEAGDLVKAMGKEISIGKPFGHIPGIEIGDKFRFRAELKVIGLHPQLVSGIHYVDVFGKICATSVVDSGQYENIAKTDTLIYSGQGGNPKLVDNASDQKLVRGNLALVNSKEMGFPVRVIYKRKNVMACRTLVSSDVHDVVYMYDGLYMVNDHWQERGENGKLVFKFELCRLEGQPRPSETDARLGKRREVCLKNDLSQGKEKIMVRVVNGVDDDVLPPFTYITKIVYPDWYKHVEPIGCDCTDGCSDFEKCSCVLKNGDEIPFNENGGLLRAKPRVHECGPSCKCPPSCMNRVTQHGPRFQLEIFKTNSRGWGVRSRNNIPIGSFVCEYVGELLRENEAEQRTHNDEYLFDICKDGFVVDAAKCGNIGRFINHSCSPNMFAQEVFYDHDDTRMPHIMFFASKNIQNSQELTYDYNYNHVFDAKGNAKTKYCYCGARKCTGRMY